MMEDEEAESAETTDSPPYQMRLPGFVTDKDVGFGDLTKRVSYAFGIKPCAGCQRRAAALNRWVVFTSRAR